MLMAVLEVIAPQFKHFGKLREFIDRKLPPGFPMQVLQVLHHTAYVHVVDVFVGPDRKYYK